MKEEVVGEPRVILSGFADEAAPSKTAVEQLACLAALGLRYYSVRFLDLGSGTKNVMKLTSKELKQLKAFHQDYGISVSSIGSPIGKVKLRDVEDGTSNVYVPFDVYLKKDVDRAIELAQELDTQLIRGFSFYPPKGSNPWHAVDETADRLCAIVERCKAAKLLYGLEVEANLVGQSGVLLAALAQKVKSPHMVLIFDGANIAVHGRTRQEIFEEYQAMLPWLGWMHVKDYRVDKALKFQGHVNEDMLRNFLPCDRGDSGHERIFRDLKEHLPKIESRLRKLGVPGFFLDLEPHLKGGGQFGGFSGPDGFGVALRSLARMLDFVGIEYDLRDYEDIEDWKRAQTKS